MSLRGKILAALGGIAIVGLAFGLGLLLADDDDGGDRTSTTEEAGVTTTIADEGEDEGEGDGSTTTTSSPLTPAQEDEELDPDLEGAAADLDAAIARAAELTFHARYEGVATTPGGDATYVIEIHRQPPNFRRDTTITSSQGALVVREYLVGGDPTVCFDQDQSGQFTCQDPPQGQAITPQQVAFGTIDPSAGTVTQDGSCFHIDVSESDQKDICFDENGVPVRVNDGTLSLEATLVELDVADDAFALPA